MLPIDCGMVPVRLLFCRYLEDRSEREERNQDLVANLPRSIVRRKLTVLQDSLSCRLIAEWFQWGCCYQDSWKRKSIKNGHFHFIESCRDLSLTIEMETESSQSWKNKNISNHRRNWSIEAIVAEEPALKPSIQLLKTRIFKKIKRILTDSWDLPSFRQRAGCYRWERLLLNLWKERVQNFFLIRPLGMIGDQKNPYK